MTKPALPFASVLLVAACGRTVATSSQSQSRLAPPEAFECVMHGFEALGFQRTMYDKGDLRTSAKKVNPKITFSSTQFRRALDRLEVEVGPGATGTELRVVATTVAEYFRQNGPNFEPLPASAEVKEAAAALERRCGRSASTPDSVPPAQ